MKAFGTLSSIYGVIGPIIDILAITFILYQTYKILAKTNGMQIIKAAVIVALIYGVARFAQLNTLRWLIEIILPGIFAAFAIVFQPELRKLFLKMGEKDWFEKFGNKSKTYIYIQNIEMVLDAADKLSKLRRGMLVVFLRRQEVKYISSKDSSVVFLDANISPELLVAMYKYDTPIHDGACFIKDNKIVCANCFSPRVAEGEHISKAYGSRHRAAMAFSDDSDCVVLVVSEENGAISLAYDGNLHYDLSIHELTTMLGKLLESTAEKKDKEEND